MTIIPTMIRKLVRLMLTTPQWMYLPAVNTMPMSRPPSGGNAFLSSWAR